MALDFTALVKAVGSLEEALDLYPLLAEEGEARRRLARDSAIQRFEYSYELAIRFLRRRLEEMDSPPEVDLLGFRELVRLGGERGLLSDPEVWFQFRALRNLSVHTYNETTAETVFARLSEFAAAARELADRLASGS